MSWEIVIRSARREDLRQRAELVEQGLLSHQWDAFVYFLFQELTLECAVLCGAVLFIFCGASPGACALLLPAAAALVALAVAVAHRALASAHAQRIGQELFGLVAEARGPLASEAPPARVRVRIAPHAEAAPDHDAHPTHAKLVGTVSVSAYRGPHGAPAGWLHLLAVHPQWRGRGAGRALAAACGRRAAANGLHALEALTSELQRPARAALHVLGWECRGTYDRPLLSAALTLPLVRLGLDVPAA